MARLLQPPITLHRPLPATPPRVIELLHPDYAPGENILLVLRALDDGGVDYDTAVIAAGIVAGNIWTGFLATRNPDGILMPIARPADGILRGCNAYFFQLPNTDVLERPYPVVVRFSDWCFPHDDLPSPWRELRPAPDQGSSCRVTDAGWSVEKAYLVPVSSQAWWIREDMSRYTTVDRFSQVDIDSDDNTLFLRSDIHKIFDEKVFTIVPKRNISLAQDTPQPSHTEEELSLVIHIFNALSDAYFNATYHNRQLLPLRYSVECLFARFAWTVFSPGVLGKFLLQCLTQRSVLVFDPVARRFAVETRSPQQTSGIYKASQSRSSSPRKRAAGEMDDEFGSVCGEDASQADSGFVDEEGLCRGRTMKRRWSGTHDEVVLKRRLQP